LTIIVYGIVLRVREAAYPPPKGSRHGEEYQEIPACAKCKSGNITRLE